MLREPRPADARPSTCAGSAAARASSPAASAPRYGWATARGAEGVRGDNEVHLGKGKFFIEVDDITWAVFHVIHPRRHDTVFGFGGDDALTLVDFDNSTTDLLDTNKDGRIDVRDYLVTVRNGSMTIDLSPGFDFAPGTLTITLVGRASIGVDQVDLLGAAVEAADGEGRRSALTPPRPPPGGSGP